MLNEVEVFELIKDQTRAIGTYRHMMERGYFIVYLADKNRIGYDPAGRWALCKHPTPKDKDEGIVLFDFFEDAFEKAKYLVWVEPDIKKCDKVYKLSELFSLIRE